MKKNTIIGIVVVLLVLGIGISFAYFVSGILVSGNGSNISITPGDMLKVEYDAGSSNLLGNKLMPGDSVSKDFSVTITPTETEKEVIYGIFINLTNNTFVKCDDSNYDELTNVCSKGEEEISYTLTNKDTEEILASGDLTGKSGKIRLITEEKEVESKRVFNYTITITFKDTGKDQNHNQNKGIEGNIEVEFAEPIKGSEYILSHYDTILTRNDFSTTVENITTGTIYKSLDESQYDDDGEVYYFAGAPTDNYVKFAGYYWRIIRINGDGSIRIIYDGTSAHGNGESSTDRQIGTSAFNLENYNRSEYVGYMYTEGEQHGNTTDSTIKGVLDDWYNNNLKSYADKISTEAGFCGDREPSTDESTSNGQGGTGTTVTYYGGYIRLITNKKPNLKCKNDVDLYTVSGSSKGNEALSNPIGLITADEAAMAGAVYKEVNEYFYLFSGLVSWTFTPANSFSTGNALEFRMGTDGLLGNSGVGYVGGIRPVINLASDVELTGSGTSNDPYVVKGA